MQNIEIFSELQYNKSNGDIEQHSEKYGKMI